MPKQSSSVDTRQFNQMCRQFAKAAGLPLEQIVKAEVGKVLESAVKYTGSAKAGKIRHQYDEFTPLGMDAHSPQRTRRFGNLRGHNLIYYMENRYPKELWARLKARRQQLIQRKLAARGLAKQSWAKVAQALGIKIAVPGFVESAIPSTGQEYNNVSASQQTNDKGTIISFSNSQPTVNAIGGAGALQRAIDGRWKYFYKSMEHGVFNSLQKVAKAYPGVKIAA